MDEVVQVLNENGEITSETINKSLAHKEGICHGISAVGLINNKGDLLIQKRSNCKINEPNKWDISGAGHISVGEDNIKAAVRELYEEIGLLVSEDSLQLIDIYLNKSVLDNGNKINHFTYLFLVKMDIDIKDLKIDNNEVSDIKYVNKESYLKMINNGEMVKGIEHCNKLLDYMK